MSQKDIDMSNENTTGTEESAAGREASGLSAALGLKPCPFCGETPPVDDPYTFYANQGEKWGHVLCGCGACGPEVRTDYNPLPHWKDAAIAEWNNRKP